MISVDEARAAIAAHVRALPSVQLPVGDAVGRVLAQDVAAAVDLPPFPQSGMDGWAARHQDIASGRLELAERDIVDVRAGAEPHRLSPGLACRISTGAPIPAGADTVIRREDADWRDGALFIAPVPECGANVRAQGETVTRGQTIGRAGQRLDAGVIGSIAGSGVPQVTVHRRPRVALVTTGDEVGAGGPSAIPDANGPMAMAFFRSLGCDVARVHAPDDLAKTIDALGAASETDLVVTTGGVSVGDHDHIVPAANAVGFETVFWRVAQRPGKPLFFAMKGGTPLLGLPGNPAAVWVQLQTQTRLILSLLEGTAPPRSAPGILTQAVSASPWADLWFRCSTSWSAEGTVLLTPLTGQASHAMANLADVDAIIRVPAKAELTAGARVEWFRTV